MYNLLLIIAIIVICTIAIIVFYKNKKYNSLQKLHYIVITSLLSFGLIFFLADIYLYFHEGSIIDYHILPHHVELEGGRGRGGIGFETDNFREGYELIPPLYDSDQYINVINTNDDTIKLNFHTIVKYGYNATDLMILVKTRDEQLYWLHPVPKQNTIRGNYNRTTYTNYIIDESSIQTNQFHWITIHEPIWVHMNISWLWGICFIIIPMLLFSLPMIVPVVLVSQKYKTLLKPISHNHRIYKPILIAAIPFIPMLVVLIIDSDSIASWVEFLGSFFIGGIVAFGWLFVFLIEWNICLQSLHQLLQNQSNIAEFTRGNADILCVRMGIWLTSTITYIFYFLGFCYLSCETGLIKYMILHIWIPLLLLLLLYVWWEIYLQRQINRVNK